MEGVIYKIENMVNGRVYIGQTVRDYKTRIKEHKYKLKNGTHHNKHLQNAYRKYGFENLQFALLETCVLDEIDNKEKEWILKYKEKSISYNLEDGGHHSKKLSKQTIEKISKQHYKPVVLLNTLEEFSSMKEASVKYGVCNSGITSSCRKERDFSGRMPNGEWMVWRYKEEVDLNEEVSFRRKTTNNKKKVVCINTKEIFNSAKEASIKYGINPTNINSCCRGERKSCLTANGERLQFGFYVDGNNYGVQKLEKLHTSVKKIICITTNEIFNSMYKAGEKYGVDVSGISNCCKGNYSYAGALQDGTKLKWAYYDDYQASK